MDKPTSPPKHLLIVDDEPVILQILRAVFENEPYRVSCASNGREAIQILEEQGCHLLLTDKNLPDISGMELLRRAKERDRTTQVIIITGYASVETAITAMELDAFDYVLKPLNNVFDIRKKARQALDKQDMILENQRLLSHLQQKNAELEVALRETQSLQAELIQSEKLAGIGTLAAGVSHEISSPLFGIMGLAEAIVDETELGLIHSYAGDIVEYCGNIRDIVVELSSYSRTASNEFLQTVEMAGIIEDALRLVERSAPIEGVKFILDLRAPIPVQARTNEVQQVFVNLIKNAAEAVLERHGTAGGWVRIHAEIQDGEGVATVVDNGPGIPAEKLSVVFDPFYTTKPPGKGTGLGLNVVYRILTKYRGTITVDSTVGTGTTFRLRIPSPSLP